MAKGSFSYYSERSFIYKEFLVAASRASAQSVVCFKGGYLSNVWSGGLAEPENVHPLSMPENFRAWQKHNIGWLCSQTALILSHAWFSGTGARIRDGAVSCSPRWKDRTHHLSPPLMVWPTESKPSQNERQNLEPAEKTIHPKWIVK